MWCKISLNNFKILFPICCKWGANFFHFFFHASAHTADKIWPIWFQIQQVVPVTRYFAVMGNKMLWMIYSILWMLLGLPSYQNRNINTLFTVYNLQAQNLDNLYKIVQLILAIWVSSFNNYLLLGSRAPVLGITGQEAGSGDK